MKKLFLLLTIICLLVQGGVARAQEVFSQEQQRVMQSGLLYFNTDRDCVNGPIKDPADSPCTCTVALDTNLIGNDHEQQAFNFFIGAPRSLTPEQSAAIVGNLIQESGVNPTAVNSSSGAYGIAQWLGGRRTALDSYAASHGGRADDMVIQLNYLWYEVTEGAEKDDGALQAIKSDTSIDAMVTDWETHFERAGKEEANIPQRITNAQKVLRLYGGNAGATTVSASSAPLGSCAGISGPGQDSKYIDGFLVYNQCDPTWKDKPYGSGGTTKGCDGTTEPNTIGTSGCGPAAMAMIITALTGQSVTPPDAADYATSQNLYESGVGSKWTIGPVLAEHWGLKSQQIGADVSKIAATLQAGGLVITAGQGAKPFTTGGHFIVIRAVTADGKFKVGDSGHSDTSDQEWDPQQLVSNMADGSVYAITK